MGPGAQQMAGMMTPQMMQQNAMRMNPAMAQQQQSNAGIDGQYLFHRLQTQPRLNVPGWQQTASVQLRYTMVAKL